MARRPQSRLHLRRGLHAVFLISGLNVPGGMAALRVLDRQERRGLG
ncbi:hypothetical protein [Deinococcus aestuarii]|nr:hypothetical protein [Deinococcus aestuarii]